MTREEIIALLECPKEDAIMHFNDDGDDEVFCSDVEAIEAVIAAFRQQQERESKPLTLDELRQMNGKPVWAIDGTGTAAYILIDADGNGIDAESGFWDADYYGLAEYKCEKFTLHRMGWLAYRHQLKNTTEG